MVKLLRAVALAGLGNLWGCLGASHTVGLLGHCSVLEKDLPPEVGVGVGLSLCLLIFKQNAWPPTFFHVTG